MRALRTVLAVKIALTAALWAGPLLLAPVAWIEALGFPEPRPVVVLRLLGMAYVALCAMYVWGWREAQAGQFPGAVVAVGILSNGGAAVVLALSAAQGAWAGWGPLAQAGMGGSLAAAVAITAGLAVAGRRARA